MELKGFIGPSYTLQATDINCQRSLNLYPQIDESQTGKNVAALLSTPGLRVFATLGTDVTKPVRGLFSTTGGRLFAVVFTTLWEVASDGTARNRGTLHSSNGFVSIAENGRALMLVDGLNGYRFDLTANQLAPLEGFPGGVSVCFQDSFFVFNQPNSQVFWVSKPYSTGVDPTMFASAEASPDNLAFLLSDHELLWLFGTNSTEVWYDSGGALFPFQRMQGGVIQFGIVGQTAVRFAGSVAWLSRDENGQGIVLMAQGLQPQRVSTHAVEQELAKYPTLTDATGYTYQQDGHTFYVLNFPSGNKTWVYDAVTQLWHERAYTNKDGLLERQRGELHAECFGKHIVSDWQNNTLYVMDRFALNDAGAPITKLRSCPYESDELENLFIARVWVDAQMGVGTTGDGPQCMLDWSDDGGATWSNEYWVPLGAIGETQRRAIWRRLGRARQRVFRLKVTDDCMLALVNAFIDVKAGRS